MNVAAAQAHEPKAKAGLAGATLDLLKTGTAARDEEALAGAFAALGTSLSAGRGADAASLGTSLLARDFEAGLALLAEVLARPRFEADKLERVRGEMLAEKASVAAKPDELLIEAFYGALYAGETYELPINGTEATLKAISLDDVRAFHAERYVPAAVTIAIVGDVDAGRVRAAVERELGGWTTPPARPEPTPPARPEPVEGRSGAGARSRFVLIDKPDQTQAHVRIGAKAIPRRHADWDALSVAHLILGGAGLASRITDVVRTKNGLAYSAGTVLIPRLEAGPLAAVAQTKSSTAAQAISLMLDELERIRREPVSAEELGRAKALLAGSLPFRLETNAHKAAALLDGELHGLGPDHLRRQIERVQALSAADVLAAARAHIRPAEATIAVVAARAQVESSLAPLAARSRAETPA